MPFLSLFSPVTESTTINTTTTDMVHKTHTSAVPTCLAHKTHTDSLNSKVVVKRLTGGITNVLFQATYYYPASLSDAFDFSNSNVIRTVSSPTTTLGDVDSTVASSAVNTAPSSSAASTTSTIVSDDEGCCDAASSKGVFNSNLNHNSTSHNNHINNNNNNTNIHNNTHNKENSITVLIRAYGNGTDTIIDRDREFATHQHLHSKNLAPQLYARFGNGLVYAYLPGRSVDYTLLSHPDVTVAVARRLAEWHSKLDAHEIESQIIALKKQYSKKQSINNTSSSSLSSSTSASAATPAFTKTFWDLLESWIKAIPTDIIKSHTQDELLAELSWIKQEIGQKGGPMVVAHCDLLAGNVIVPPTWTPRSLDKEEEEEEGEVKQHKKSHPPLEISFIDYEYAMASPRAFDIANHFMEWQGFDCIKELIPEPKPDNAVIRGWAHDYLSYFSHKSHVNKHNKNNTSDNDKNHNDDERNNDENVDILVNQILTWWGMPGFYWGIWSAIQSTISDIEFDYANYANERLAEYWNWKKDYLGNK